MRLRLFASLLCLLNFSSIVLADSEVISAHQAAAILTKNCAGCHQMEKHPGALFLNEARLTTEETMKLLIRLLETGQMPPTSHKRFSRSEDGKKLQRWLKSELAPKKN